MMGQHYTVYVTFRETNLTSQAVYDDTFTFREKRRTAVKPAVLAVSEKRTVSGPSAGQEKRSPTNIS